jgi:hypothetical protein
MYVFVFYIDWEERNLNKKKIYIYIYICAGRERRGLPFDRSRNLEGKVTIAVRYFLSLLLFFYDSS